MCLQRSSVLPWDSWNWSGDEIIPSPIIRASRCIPGTKRRYDTDIREFLTTTNNAVVHQRLGQLISELPQQEQAAFRSHSPKSFDLRADRVVQFISKLRYKPSANKDGRCPDAWLFPDETLCQGGGDCEDLALLLAAFLIASGISGYCIRVAMGSLSIHLPDGTTQRHDHSWVMYQNEAGIWEILEPLYVVAPGRAKSKSLVKSKSAPPTEYIPHFVFNSDHLWRIDSFHTAGRAAFPVYCRERTFWKRFDPSFAAGVHNDIFDDALGALGLPDGAMAAIKRESLYLDANIATYDPRDHFDNGYIDAGWAKVNSNLDDFRADKTKWAAFGAAGHGIADFYAHSSYAHFAPLQNGAIPPYETGIPMTVSPSYTATPADPSLPPFDLTSGKFSVNPDKWKGSPQEAAANWAGQLISGRYAQSYDPKAGFWEGFTSIPWSLANAAGFALRGSLPHHNEIAVDDLTRPSKHVLYVDASSGPNDRQNYKNQFSWRKQAAIQHIARICDQITNGGS